MKQQSASPDPVSDSVRAEAAVWVARLHNSGRSGELEEGFRRWLNNNPQHARAFELATEAWEIGGSAQALPRTTDPFLRRQVSRTFTPRRLFAVVATLIAISTLALFLHFGVPVTTDVGEQRMLTLSDGTRITLNTDTRLFVQGARRRIRLLRGEVLFEIAKDPQRPFVVTAGREREVVALGTTFMVRHDVRHSAVTLIDGKVAIRNDHGSVELVLDPGQRATFAPRGPPQLDEPSIEEVTAWRRGEVVLDKTPLPEAVTEMNRYSTVKLVIASSAAAHMQITGVFRTGDSARFAAAVGEIYGLPVRYEPRRIVIGAQD